MDDPQKGGENMLAKLLMEIRDELLLREMGEKRRGEENGSYTQL